VQTHTRRSASGFQSFDDAPYCLLVTFRRSGAPVPTPVCFGIEDSTMYLRSEGNLGKVKRIRNNPAVQVAPCGRQGAPLACAIEARARLITDKREQRRAEKAIQRNYGLLRLIYRTFAPLMRVHPVYVAVTPEREGTLSSIPGRAQRFPSQARRHGR
jgi:PPOX class probable F420-dependent enzyme